MLKKIILYPFRVVSELIVPGYKEKLAEYIASLCDNKANILDVGCGDGSLTKRIMEINTTLKIIGLDIRLDKNAKIPVKVYNGKKIPYKSNTFDTVIVLDVLHHTSDILSLLKEIKRVTRKDIIIKDHAVDSIFSKYFLSFTDYMTNAPYGIKCTFNFPSLKEWNSYFNKLNLKLIEQPKNLNYGFMTNERYNPIFKLVKK